MALRWHGSSLDVDHLRDSHVVSLESATQWGLVIPVKQLGWAKSRLAPLGDAQRRDLALAFACDVVVAALAAEQVAKVLVVTRDPSAGEVLTALGATIAEEPVGAGLNAAVRHGLSMLGDLQLNGTAVLAGDLPALQADELDAALAAVPSGEVALVADAEGVGTTLLAGCRRPSLQPAFGPGSRTRHLQAGAVELAGGPGLRRDVDTPAQLCEALAIGVGRHTEQVVAGRS